MYLMRESMYVSIFMSEAVSIIYTSHEHTIFKIQVFFHNFVNWGESLILFKQGYWYRTKIFNLTAMSKHHVTIILQIFMRLLPSSGVRYL